MVSPLPLPGCTFPASVLPAMQNAAPSQSCMPARPSPAGAPRSGGRSRKPAALACGSGRHAPSRPGRSAGGARWERRAWLAGVTGGSAGDAGLASLCYAGIGVACCRAAPAWVGCGGLAAVRAERRAVVLLPVVSADGTGPVGSRRVVRAGAGGRRWRAAPASGAVLLAGLPGRGRRRPGRGRAGCSSAARSARRNGAGPGAVGRDRGDTPAPGGDDPRGR